jgi:hypothetical protein
MTPQYIEITARGSKVYYNIEWWDGDKTWALNGVKLSEREFLKRTGKETILTMDEIAAKFGIEVSKLKIAK